MNKLRGYDFSCCSDTQTLDSSIVEGRLVPKDLSAFNEITSSNNAYFYVDADGIPSKISLEYILSGGINIVPTEPEGADIGTIIFEEIL